MTTSPVIETLRATLAATSASADWCVAFSGGLDSTVLLQGLHELATELGATGLRAIHIHHGLYPEADNWVVHCESIAAGLGIPMQVERVKVDLSSGDGVEAAARRARYNALAESLQPGEILMTAHHAEDQVETVLLRLLRGAGVRGLGSIRTRSRFGRGWLVRPLLTSGQGELEEFARARQLSWIEDPANRDTAFDRTFLRHEVVPLLRARWPGLAAALGRSARLSDEAAQLLHDVGREDSAAVLRATLIDVNALQRLAPARQRNLVRYVLHERGLSPPTEVQLVNGLHQLVSARVDRQPLLRWPGGEIRRYRGHLYVLTEDPDLANEGGPDEIRWDTHQPLDLGAVRGRLRVIRGESARPLGRPLTVRFRRGGERLREADAGHHKQLKKVFQSLGVVPWMRPHIPLIVDNGELLAVGDLWLNAALCSRGGPIAGFAWDRHAEIH